MRHLAWGTILYTDAEAAELRAASPNGRLFVAPNALYRANTMRPAIAAGGSPSDIVFVGRLADDKKPGDLLRAFERILPNLPKDTRLVFVGDGPLRQSLEMAAKNLGDSVQFRGHVSDPVALKATFGKAIASVSPGYAGLSLTQSLGFGVPMIISRHEPHAPEIVAAQEGWNAVFYDGNVAGALEQAILEVVAAKDMWTSRREVISLRCREAFSVEAMAAGLLDAIGRIE